MANKEIQESLRFWIKRTQAAHESNAKFVEEEERLGLYKDSEEVIDAEEGFMAITLYFFHLK